MEILELKNILSEVKNWTDGLNSSMEGAEKESVSWNIK